MKIAAFIVTLLACCLMFFVKREWKVALLVMGAMTLTAVYIPGIPLHSANYLLPVAFFLSEWRDWPRHFRALLHVRGLAGMLLLVSISALIAALNSPYLAPREILQGELLFKFFAVAYAFWAVKDERSLKPILLMSFVCLLVLTGFGILNYLTKSADFVNALTEGRTGLGYKDIDMGSIYTESDRFRVQSMFVSPFDYGFICVVMLLLHWYGWLRGMENKIIFALATICCLFGVITCECRIVWVCCILSVSCFYMWCYPFRKAALAAILVITAFIISYSTVKFVEERVDRMTDVFKENSKTEGSSIDMRMAQMATTWYQLEGHELFGRGQGFWAYNLKNDSGRRLDNLEGMESAVFQLLLERGIFGLVVWIVFYTWLFSVFWRDRHLQPKVAGLAASVWTAYVLFAIGTGELGTGYPTLLLLGMSLKVLEEKKRRRRLLSLLLSLIKSKKQAAQ